MRLTGYQPQYFPRLHYFARILDADIFKITDYVQFVRYHQYLQPDGTRYRGPSYQVHTPIKLASGTYLLTVPSTHRGFTAINETGIDYLSKWPHKHVKTIEIAYGKAKNAKKIVPQLSQLLDVHYDNLSQLNVNTILWALAWILDEPDHALEDLTIEKMNQLLGSKPHPFRLRRLVLVSQTDIPPRQDNEDATDWIIDSCRRLRANEYYHGGTAATAYLDLDRLQKAGIKPIQQQWTCQLYQQQHPRAEFLPNLSIIDLLMNCDQEQVWKVLQGSSGALSST